MDIKKTSTRDIYKCIIQDYSGLYKKLQTALGEQNPFAKFDIGAGKYIWSCPSGTWHQMIVASDIKQDFVREELAKLKEDVSVKVGAKTADILFTYPDDSYVYYNDDNGEIHILLTGWGFKKPVGTQGDKDVEDISKKNPVNLSFSYDGVKVPNYEFGLRLDKQVKVLKTSDYGVYSFDNLRVGENYILTDIKSDKTNRLSIVEGKSDYDFDITEYAPISVNALYDEHPIVGEEIHIGYNGKTYACITDSYGNAQLKVPFHSGIPVYVEMRGEQQSETIEPDDNKFSFRFEKEKEPEVTIDVVVRVMEDGSAVSGKTVRVNYGSQSYDLLTGENGECRQSVVYHEGESCNVTVPEYESQQKNLNSEKDNIFVFEKTTDVVDTPKRTMRPHILIEGDNGYIGSKYPISVEINGVTQDYVSDEYGIVSLPEVTEGEIMKVTDGLNPTNVEEYELDTDKEEYIFHVPYEPTSDSKDLKIMVRDKVGNKVSCDYIRFQQEGAEERLGHLDDEGNTYFAKGTFALGKTIQTSIIGANRDFPVIPFTLEENEYEYLLQEKSSTAWWIILLEILLVLVTIACLWLYWPFLQDFCTSMFNNIYNN